MQTGTATVKNSSEDRQKFKKGTTSWPSDSTSGYIPEETQNINLKEYMHSYVYYSIIYNLQDMEAAQVSINRWMCKNVVVHVHN